MALVIGKKESRIIPVEAKEPLDGDKVTLHKFDVEFEIIPRDLWSSMSERWEELAQQLRASPDAMTGDDSKEAREPIWKIAKPYIRAIGPLLDDKKQPMEFTPELLDAILAEPWLQQPIADAFMCVQLGLTNADYRKTRLKN
jgi:hypothetical protein